VTLIYLSLQQIDHSDRTINKEASELNCTVDKVDLTDIYRIFHPTAVEYTLFSALMELSPKQITF
jgi:hypothetical protein